MDAIEEDVVVTAKVVPGHDSHMMPKSGLQKSVDNPRCRIGQDLSLAPFDWMC